MVRRALWLGLCLSVVLAGQEIQLATGAWAGLSDTGSDCSVRDRVRSIHITRSETERDARELAAICLFDEKGRIFDFSHYFNYGKDGKQSQRFVTRFDRQGHSIEIDDFDMEKDPQHPQRFLTKYDAEGRELGNRSIDSDGSINYRIAKEYDGRGDAVKETDYDGSSGEIRSETIRKYDDAHHVIREESRGRGSNAGSTKIFRYNDAGQQIEAAFDGGTRQLYTYDESGQLISSETITRSPGSINAYGLCGDCGTFPGKTIYRYNDDGLVIEERKIQPGNVLVALRQYAYDDHGHHTREWVYEAIPSGTQPGEFKAQVDGEDVLFNWSNGLRSTSYTYDSHGNWIKAVETRLSSNVDAGSKRVIASIVYRSIKYY